MSSLFRGPREGWLSLLMLLAVVLSPAISLANADWVADLHITPQLAFFGVLVGVVLAKLPIRGVVSHLLALEVGVLLVGAYFAGKAAGGEWEERVLWLWGRVWNWLQAAFGGGMSNDAMLFALLMGLSAWMLGYLSAWFVFRQRNAWPPLVACGSALLVNLSYATPNALSYFLAFLLASLLLLVRINLSQKERDWHRSDAEYNRGLTWRSLVASTLLSITVLAGAWALPIGTVNVSVAESWYSATGPWQGLQLEFDRLFASVGSSTGKVEGNRFTKTLALKGAIELGQEMVMLVASPRPEYWAAQTYDRYTGQGWMSSADQVTRLDSNDPRLAETSLYKGREDVEQRFKLLVGRSYGVFAATSPVKLSLPVYVDHFSSLDELAAVRSTIPVRQNQQYAVVSSVSVASVEELQKAGTDYPEWAGRYLELPSNMSRRVVGQARRLVREANNPYDAALAIQDYARGFTYDIDVTSPPPDRDAVEWFLFTSREGYCDYFASAMAVMARSVGIPSRVVSGYNTGTFNQETGLYEVRQENAHSWPELFFPTYGWVRFEPTPSQPPVEREEKPSTELKAADGTTAEELQALDFDLTGRDKMLLDDGLDLSNSGERWAAASTEEERGAVESALLATPLALAALLGALWLAARVLLSRLSVSRRAYLQMAWLGGLLGLGLRPSYTPREYARVLVRATPALRPEVETVVDGYEQETYASRQPSDEKEIDLSWRRMRSRLPLEMLLTRLFRRG